MKSQLIRYFVFVLVGLVIISCDDDAVAPPDVVSSFTASKTTVEIGEVIQFTNTSQNATAFKWSFGDGTSSTEANPVHQYQRSGDYEVCFGHICLYS